MTLNTKSPELIDFSGEISSDDVETMAVRAPQIFKIIPKVPLAKWGIQKIRLHGKNFDKDLTVTMTFGGRVYNLRSASIRFISNSIIDIYVVLGKSPGRWTFKVKNSSNLSATFHFYSKIQVSRPNT